MSKEIKDYLHLYLGCEVAVIDKMAAEYNCEEIIYTDKLKGVTESEVKPGEMIAIIGDVFQEEYIDRIKPILRPLSDMTEEEFKELAEKCFGFNMNEAYKQRDAVWGRKRITKERLRLAFDLDDYYTIHVWQEFTSEDKKLMPPLSKINHFVNECRKLSFDMDGLIESGLAIDKTKIKDHE